MSIFEAVILGAVQGITEFLPVSSSGHLVLFQRIFGISGDNLLFDTLVHGGTLIAVFIVLWEDIRGILRRIVQPLTAYLILGTIPAVIAALLFDEAIEKAFSTGNFLGFAFLITAILLFGSEMLRGYSQKRRDPVHSKKMNWFDALIIGILQAIAIIPGVSRSGSTLSGALFRRLDRDFAARFSFLLSIPAILGALVLQIKDLFKGAGAPETGMSPAAMIAGVLTAALVGFFSIRLMLKIVRERSLLGFAAYTAVLGILVLIDRSFSHIFF
jgi:undecaprenyl-diphosphatase